MKVLITGANGQLGKEFVKIFQDKNEIVATDNHNLDITNLSKVSEVLTREKPDLLVNSAAFTDVEGCAKDPEKANLINGIGNKNLSEIAKEIGAKLIYVSTNEVFDGKKSDPYTEVDKTNPINPYAKSKLLGEKYCQEILDGNFIIARTSWLYGQGSTVNFPNKIISRAKEFNKLVVVDDEVAVPTYALDLVVWIKELVDMNKTGIFHLINNGSCSRFDWAKQIVEEKGLNVPITKSKLKDYNRLSTPPNYSVLSNEKAKGLGLKFRSWQEASKEYLSSIM